MHILIVAATPPELAPFQFSLQQRYTEAGMNSFKVGNQLISILYTGIGLTATAWQLGLYFSRRLPDLAVNAGIAGAIDRSIPLGRAVQVVSEQFADLGSEDADGSMLDLFSSGLLDRNAWPYTNGKLIAPSVELSFTLPQVQAVSVNKVTGAAGSIERLRLCYPEAQLESMEGAAFFYACLSANVPFVEIRSVSNYVEPRNRAAWEIPKAVDQLNTCLTNWLLTNP